MKYPIRCEQRTPTVGSAYTMQTSYIVHITSVCNTKLFQVKFILIWKKMNNEHNNSCKLHPSRGPCSVRTFTAWHHYFVANVATVGFHFRRQKTDDTLQNGPECECECVCFHMELKTELAAV